MVIDATWDTATAFGPKDRAQVSVVEKPSRVREFFRHWIPGFRRIGIVGVRYYKIDRFGNTTPSVAAESAFFPVELPNIPTHFDHRTFKEQQVDYQYKGDDPATVDKDGRWGFINRQGETITPFQWDETRGFDGNGRACVAIDGKWGVIDRKGRLVVPLYFKELSGFDAKNMCAAQLASGWGFIDPEGKILIPFRYQKAGNFDRFDMARIEIANHQGQVHCGWINRRGETVVPAIYQIEPPDWFWSFKSHDLLPVIGPQGSGLIDRKGRTVVAEAHDELIRIEDPAARGKFWITTVRPPSFTPPAGASRLSYVPTCYDQTGKVIWNDGILASPSSFMICAVILGLIAAALFALEIRNHRSKSTKV